MSVNKYNPSTGTLTTLASGDRTWIGTKAQYDAQKTAGTLPNNALIVITDDEQQTEAEQISYDNTDSGLTADNVQDAIDVLSNHKSIKYIRVFAGNDTFDWESSSSGPKPLKIISNSNANVYLRCSGILLLIDDWLYFNGCVGESNFPSSGSYMGPSTCSISSVNSALSNLQWDPDWVDSLPQNGYGDLVGCGYLIYGGTSDTFAPVKGTLNLTTNTYGQTYTVSTTKIYFCGKVVPKT